jgi:trans-aconitate methyltransferase
MESPIKVFSDWVISGKDEGMEKGHSPAVKNMLEYSTKELTDYSFIDAGCGNGWVVRNIGSDHKCNKAIGVDGSLNMIEKAKKLDRKNQYFCTDLMNWSPNKKVNIVHSMEVFYYFERPDKLIQHVYENWMLEGGRLIMGIDYYHENKPSHTWKEDCCITTMKMFAKSDWVDFFKTTGFKNLESWYHGKDGDWNGTLIVTGIK